MTCIARLRRLASYTTSATRVTNATRAPLSLASMFSLASILSLASVVAFDVSARGQEPALRQDDATAETEETALQGGGQIVEKIAAPAPKLGLQECLDLGMQNQPALAAARASLAAAYSGERGVSGIRFGRLLAPDLPIRRQQACLGITIASAGLEQAEWETRYAVRRTYYSVQYARMQKAVTDSALEKIDQAHAQAKKLVKAGDPEFKVTTIDIKVLEINKEFLRTKQAEATVGVDKAIAALREAIGIGPDYPLDVAVEPLPPLVKDLNKEELISVALSRRPELVQAATMNDVVSLEISAQQRIRFSPQAKTFASAADIHAKPIPQGVANGEYRPGAIGPEMPVYLVGRRNDRVARAADFNDRAIAVVDKTQNLIALEAAATYLKWLEAAQNVTNLSKTPEMAQEVVKDVQNRFNDGKASGEEYLRARTLEDQAKALYNDALFQHALALAALERVTAGGFLIPSAPGVAPGAAKP
jgi:outer membrane protein TolC